MAALSTGLASRRSKVVSWSRRDRPEQPEKEVRMNTTAMMAQMLEHAGRMVLGEMRLASQLAALAGRSDDEMRRNLEAWKAEGRIFWVEHEGAEYFPLFAFDPDAGYRPYPAVAAVLAILPAPREGWSRWALASWFIGLNSFLDHQRPMDLVALDYDWVVDAAEDMAECLALRNS
jgi:hypothetical protein